MGQKKIKLQNIVWKEGKYYVSRCLNVEVASFGKTKVEALKNLKEALELYFEGMDGRHKVVEIKFPVIIQQMFEYA